jgi:hypothetical protein
MFISKKLKLKKYNFNIFKQKKISKYQSLPRILNSYNVFLTTPSQLPSKESTDED